MRVSRFSFNLQLFGEDETVAESAVVSSLPSIQSDDSVASVLDNIDNSSVPQYGVVVDPGTGRREVREIESKSPEDSMDANTEIVGSIEQSLDEQSQNEDVQQTNCGCVEPYSEEELGTALRLGNVDESRIPEGYREQYNRYRAEQMANQSVDNGTENSELDRVEQRRAFYNQIDDISRNLAFNELGLTEADLEAFQYDDSPHVQQMLNNFNTATMFIKNKLIGNYQELEREIVQRQQQQVAIYDDVRSFVDNAVKSEPNFKQIDNMMMLRYKRLPYEEGQKIASAVDSLHGGTITPEQCQILQKYYEDTRREFYARSNKLSTKPMMVRPPVVEGSGTGASEPQSFDFGKMRNMDRRSRQKFIADYFNQHKQ